MLSILEDAINTHIFPKPILALFENMATEAPSRGSARVPCVEPEKVAHPFGNSWYVSSAVSTPILDVAFTGAQTLEAVGWVLNFILLLPVAVT